MSRRRNFDRTDGEGSTEHWLAGWPGTAAGITGATVIRAAERRDFPSVSRLITTADELFLVFPGGSWPFTPAQVHRIAEQRSDLTVVTDHHAVVGFANLYDLVPGQWAFVGNLIVHSSYRGQGIGRHLLGHMLHTVFVRHDLPRARISVFATNRPARRLYSDLGFTTYAREERRHPDGLPTGLLHMQLDRSRYKGFADPARPA